MKWAVLMCLLLVSRVAVAAEPIEFESTAVSLQFSVGEARCLAFSHDGKLLAVGYGRWNTAGGVRLWDTQTGKEVAFVNEGIVVPTIDFSPDDKMLVLNRWGGEIIFRSVKTLDQLPTHSFGTKSSRSSLSSDGKKLLTVSEKGSLKLWDVKTGDELREFEGETFPYRYIAFSSDGKLVCAGGGEFGEN